MKTFRVGLLFGICVTIFLYQHADKAGVWIVKLSDSFSRTNANSSHLRRNITKINLSLFTTVLKSTSDILKRFTTTIPQTTITKNLEFTITDLRMTCPSRNLTSLPGMCYKFRQNFTINGTKDLGNLRCVMTFNKWGRLGNNMGQYATLITLSRWNQRPAYMLPEVAQTLRAYFQVTMPVLPEEANKCLEKNWTDYMIYDWMRDEYREIDVPPEKPLKLWGCPCSWTFFHHIRQEIQDEFRLHPPIKERAQRDLRALIGNQTSSTTTFVGVHVRRSDYVGLMAGMHKGVVADAKFFVNATEYFRSHYPDAIFVVASDDMAWCRKNIDNSLGDVFFAGSGLVADPISDFALLTQCNHSIITIGTFGFWIAYLTGGEVVYLNNYLLPDSPFHKKFHFDAAYLPTWIPIDADLSQFPGYVNKNVTSKN